MARKRTKIRYCYEDYMNNSSAVEKAEYQEQFAPLIDIITRAEDDKEVMALAKAYDSEHGTEMFAEAVHLTVYCIACSKFDCDC
ncbi:hypothetical protein SAMN02745220_02646 [Desulfopila aestuarii DSM 18488]|uniref:Uncharacterized protein n=2 Tax=Desulfopila aestuarii TaxID=231440 RepID=A0A1M7Y8S9_9BACT|nr:hypothetical protein SAMN02745220_02646 [Desulfopila aestuarii DSM 18488]